MACFVKNSYLNFVKGDTFSLTLSLSNKNSDSAKSMVTLINSKNSQLVVSTGTETRDTLTKELNVLVEAYVKEILVPLTDIVVQADLLKGTRTVDTFTINVVNEEGGTFEMRKEDTSGWPYGRLSARVKIIKDGKTLSSEEFTIIVKK